MTEEMRRGVTKGQYQDHTPAKPYIPHALGCSCIPYNGSWPLHRLSAYGNSVCSFCHAKHGVEENKQSSFINNPVLYSVVMLASYAPFDYWTSALLY